MSVWSIMRASWMMSRQPLTTRWPVLLIVLDEPSFPVPHRRSIRPVSGRSISLSADPWIHVRYSRLDRGEDDICRQ